MSKEIKILEYIKQNPESNLKQIIKQNNITEITTKKILFDLISKNLIKYKNNKYSSIDYIKSQKLDLDKDTFFGVFIKNKDKEIIKYLFEKITNYWIKSNNYKPTTTQIYKILVEINNKNSLNLPIVWYKYGQIPIVSYNLQENQNIKDFSNLISDKQINKIVIENSRLSSREIKLKQYNFNHSDLNKVYLLKEQIINRYYKNDFLFVKNNFNVFFRKLPYFKDTNKIIDDFYEFVCSYNQLERKKQIKIEFKDLFYNLFIKFWEIVSINNFKKDLNKYYEINNLDIDLSNYNFNLNILKEEFYNLIECYYQKIIK